MLEHKEKFIPIDEDKTKLRAMQIAGCIGCKDNCRDNLFCADCIFDEENLIEFQSFLKKLGE